MAIKTPRATKSSSRKRQSALNPPAAAAGAGGRVIPLLPNTGQASG